MKILKLLNELSMATITQNSTKKADKGLIIIFVITLLFLIAGFVLS